MKKFSFAEALAQILSEDTRYDPEAYQFVRQALDYSIRLFEKPVEGPGRHVSGAELLEGARKLALKEYGPLAKTVLARWGIRQTEDIGAIVFRLVDKGVLGKTDEDDLADFSSGYDFDAAFRAPFRPDHSDCSKGRLPPDREA
jgi:uncharacterized repeat protein (TIGR04138 family)